MGTTTSLLLCVFVPMILELAFSDGLLWLFLMGCVFRLWVLVVLLLLKHSEGNSCIGRLVHLTSKWLNKLGFEALLRPKHGDAADSVVVLERKPSKINEVAQNDSTT